MTRLLLLCLCLTGCIINNAVDDGVCAPGISPDSECVPWCGVDYPTEKPFPTFRRWMADLPAPKTAQGWICVECFDPAGKPVEGCKVAYLNTYCVRQAGKPGLLNPNAVVIADGDSRCQPPVQAVVPLLPSVDLGHGQLHTEPLWSEEPDMGRVPRGSVGEEVRDLGAP